MSQNLSAVCRQFGVSAIAENILPFGGGHINDTYCVNAADGNRYILQRINHNVFRQPEKLMENYERVTAHLAKRLTLPARTIEILHADGLPYAKDEAGNYFRCYNYIDHVISCNVVESAAQANAAAQAFGLFQKELSDLPGPRLHETIVDFHNTPKRFEMLQDAIKADAAGRVKSVSREIDFVMARQAELSRLIDLQKAGEIPERITHNDTKLNNVLLSDTTGEGIAVIDLDTVMPGLAHYDFGDMVRTGVSPAAEDEVDLSKVGMRFEIFEALLRGYLAGTGGCLNAVEKEELPFSGKLITLEIGIRFLADYLAGDVYFKIHREHHNLDRCRTQFKLVESIESQFDDMMKLLRSI